MKKKRLEDILHALHNFYESLEEIIKAMAKSVGINGKSSSLNLTRIRSIVFVSFAVVAVFAISVNGVDMTTSKADVLDLSPINQTNQSVDLPMVKPKPTANSKLCLDCHGTGVTVEWVNYSTEVDCPNCVDGYLDKAHEFICSKCSGKGYLIEETSKAEYLTCTTCKGSGYLSA